MWVQLGWYLCLKITHRLHPAQFRVVLLPHSLMWQVSVPPWLFVEDSVSHWLLGGGPLSFLPLGTLQHGSSLCSKQMNKRVREAIQDRSHVLKVTSYHFCYILLVRSQLLGSAHLPRRWDHWGPSHKLPTRGGQDRRWGLYVTSCQEVKFDKDQEPLVALVRAGLCWVSVRHHVGMCWGVEKKGKFE